MLSNWLGLGAGQAAPLLAVKVHVVLNLHRGPGTHRAASAPLPECEPDLSLRKGGRETSGEARSEQQILNLGPSIPSHSLFLSMGREKSGDLGLIDLSFQLLKLGSFS